MSSTRRIPDTFAEFQVLMEKIRRNPSLGAQYGFSPEQIETLCPVDELGDEASMGERMAQALPLAVQFINSSRSDVMLTVENGVVTVHPVAGTQALPQ